jgi:DNA-binding transcriptional ArsR family regulator
MANQSATLDGIFRALSDPTRRAVLGRLGQGDASVSELAEPFAMALPSFMKHLGVLQDAGLIVSRKNGRVRTCALDRERLIAAEIWFGEQHARWQQRYSNLDEVLSELGGKEA